MAGERTGGFLSLLPDHDQDSERSKGKSELAHRILSRVPVKTPPLNWNRSMASKAKNTAQARGSGASPSGSQTILSSDSDSSDDDVGPTVSKSVSHVQRGCPALVSRIREMLANGKHREAAWAAIEALREYPENGDLGKLVDEALESMKKFPRFQESLAVVSLTGPQGNAVIGNCLLVEYRYGHMTPVTEFKRFAPLSRAIRDKVKKHDESLLRNSKLDVDYVHNLVDIATCSTTTAASTQSYVKQPQLLAQLPRKRPDLGEGWTEDDEKVLREIYEDMKKYGSHVHDMCEAAKGRLEQDLLKDAPAMFRMLKLYDTIQNGVCVYVCA
jgi:hypothetical protein